MGAIGDPEVLDILKQYSTDPVVEVTGPGPPSPCPRLDQPQTLGLFAMMTTWLGILGRGGSLDEYRLLPNEAK